MSVRKCEGEEGGGEREGRVCVGEGYREGYRGDKDEERERVCMRVRVHVRVYACACVCSTSSLQFTLAPAAINVATTFSCPYRAAEKRGVSLSLVHGLICVV